MGWQVVYVPFLFAGNTIINQNGIFVYNGVPGPGTLKASITGTAGTDDFGNPYTDNIAAYNQAGNGNNFIQIAVNPTTGIPFLVLEVPNNPTNVAGEPQVNASTINAGAVNEQAQINVTSGFETAQGAAGAATVQTVSRSNDGTVASLVNLIGDVTDTTLPDGNNYRLGQKDYSASNIPITSVVQTPFLSIGPLAAGQTYHLTGFVIFSGNQAAGQAVFSWGASGGLVLGSIQNGYERVTGGGVIPVVHTIIAPPLGTATSPAFGAAATSWLLDIDLNVNVTTAGTLLFRGNESIGGDSFNIDFTSVKLSPI
jgi:hypothetical protein